MGISDIGDDADFGSDFSDSSDTSDQNNEFDSGAFSAAIGAELAAEADVAIGII